MKKEKKSKATVGEDTGEEAEVEAVAEKKKRKGAVEGLSTKEGSTKKVKDDQPDEPKSGEAAKPVEVSASEKERLTKEALADILKGISQPDSQKTKPYIPDMWHMKYKPVLGAYKKFVLAHPDKLAVVYGEAGSFAIHKPGSPGGVAPPVPAGKKAQDWKALLANAWNKYCSAVPKHERSVEVFVAALPKGTQNAKATGTQSPKVGSRGSPKLAPAQSPKMSPALAPAVAPSAEGKAEKRKITEVADQAPALVGSKKKKVRKA